MNPLEPIVLDPIDLERLLFTLESSVSIDKRVQFFLWSQGALQSFLPHETLLCVHGDLGNRRYGYEVFSRAVLSEDFNRAASDAIDGLIPELLDGWYANGQMPLAFGAAKSESAGSSRAGFPRHLRRLGLLPAFVHGSRLVDGQHATLFIMLRTPAFPDRRTRYMAELLMPHLHLAWHRVLCADRDPEVVRANVSESPLTDRELEVLNWVREGKTNAEIAAILGLSPLTVKNHVRKILQKLKVSNRAQAVARGLSARLFRRQLEQAAPDAGRGALRRDSSA